MAVVFLIITTARIYNIRVDSCSAEQLNLNVDGGTCWYNVQNSTLQYQIMNRGVDNDGAMVYLVSKYGGIDFFGYFNATHGDTCTGFFKGVGIGGSIETRHDFMCYTAKAIEENDNTSKRFCLFLDLCANEM